MKARRQAQPDHDAAAAAVGIVITPGMPALGAPRFSAFVWGPVPDEAESESATRAA